MVKARSWRRRVFGRLIPATHSNGILRIRQTQAGQAAACPADGPDRGFHLREKALQGDDRAIKHIIELAFRFNDDAGETAAPNLPPDDQAILADYRAEILAAARPTTPAEPPSRDGVEPGPESSPKNDKSTE